MLMIKRNEIDDINDKYYRRIANLNCQIADVTSDCDSFRNQANINKDYKSKYESLQQWLDDLRTQFPLPSTT